MARTKQRENYGNGSVTPVKVDGKQKVDRRGLPVWRVCVTLGTEEYVDGEGRLRRRQRKVQKTYHGTLRDARSYRDALVEQYENASPDHARDTFSALVEEWSKSDDLGCSEKQRKQYLRLLGYCAPYLDQKPLVELRKPDVNEALAKAVVRPDGKQLAPTTATKMRATVRRVFEYAVDEDYIASNPCRTKRRRRASTQTKPVQQRRALSEEEAARLCACLDASELEAYRAFDEKEARQAHLNNTFGRTALRGLGTLSNILAVRLMLATGMRRGEALGMEWGNLDLDEGTARVAQTLNESMEMNRPKTDNGIRNLCIDERTVEHLRRWKAFQAKALHLVNVDGAALSQSDATPVFCTDNGGWIDPTNCYRWWKEYRAAHGFDGWVLHELRHSQVTLLLGNGVPWEMVQTRVGHSRPSSVTMTYLHELPAHDRQAAEVMGRILYDGERTRGTVISFQKPA